MTKIINGKEIAADLRDKLKKEILEFKKKLNIVPGLAVVQIGDIPASSVYVKAKTKNALEVGIEVIDHHLNENTTERNSNGNKTMMVTNKSIKKQAVKIMLIQILQTKHYSK